MSQRMPLAMTILGSGTAIPVPDRFKAGYLLARMKRLGCSLIAAPARCAASPKPALRCAISMRFF